MKKIDSQLTQRCISQLHRLEGQIHGVEKMIVANKKTATIIQQISAIQGSLRTLQHRLLLETLSSSASDELKDCAKYLAKLH